MAVSTPLRLTVWVLVVAAGVTIVLVAIGVTRHLESVRAEHRRERVRGQLQPLFERFFQSQDQVSLAEELRPTFMRMDAAERPVAALLVAALMQEVSPAHKQQLRGALEEAGIIELGHRGTRRRSPWRRALACEMLGKIGARRSVPVVLDRLADRRPEVRMAAVRALGDIGSTDAVPALSAAFLNRRVAPTNVVNDALRRIGVEAAGTFTQGLMSADPIVRISSCFGLSTTAQEHRECLFRLGQLLDADSDARVRTAAAAAMGMLGGEDAPAALYRATVDPEVQVRRSAVKALGSFDDPNAVETLDGCTDDEDREVALRAAEALLALTHHPRAATEARARLESSSDWAVEYARAVAEITG